MDAPEFDAFYAASYRRVVAQLYAMVGDRDLAEECTQEAFARAWAHRRKLDRELSPQAWVRTTAYRLAVSRWRQLARRSREPDRSQAHRDVAELNTDHVALVESLKRLPAAQRQVVVLHHIADLSVDAISVELQIPPGTVKTRLARGRRALASMLGADAQLQQGAHHA